MGTMNSGKTSWLRRILVTFGLVLGLTVGVTAIVKAGPESWTWASSPGFGAASYLFGVAMTSASDGWAVGYYDTFDVFTEQRPHVVRWNGTDWLTVTSPYPSGTVNAELMDVAVVAPKDVWAVGH
jgi:photosystem II stability/assembly factor-like uncharacterized protein